MSLPFDHVSAARYRARRLVAGAIGALLVLAPVAATTAQETGARVAGRVLAGTTARPVVSAIVSLAGRSLSTRVDSTGRFVLPDVPPGTHTLAVRAIGFQERSLRFDARAGDALELDVLLEVATPELTSVEVTASRERRSMYYDEFLSRRKLGNGRYLEWDDIADDRNQPLSTILRTRIPGVRVVRYGGGRMALASGRGSGSSMLMPQGDAFDRTLGAPVACYVQVLVNDLIMYSGNREETLYNIDLLQPDRIEAIEFYTSATVPPRFNRGSNGSCGTMVIWLRP